MAARLAESERAVAALESRRAELDPGMAPETFLTLLRQYEAVVERMQPLAAYGTLWFASDTQSEEALTFRNRVEQALTAAQNRLLFLNLWWKGLDDEAAARLLPPPEEEPDLRYFLEELRRFRPHTLAEREEQIVNLKDADGIEAVLTIYSMLTNRMEFHLEVPPETGEPRRALTRDEIGAYVFSPRPEVREAAYRELLRVYAGEARILGQLYVHRARDWASEQLTLRGFPSSIGVRNFQNDVPDGAVETLLRAARRNAGVFQRYFRLKAGWLGLERLRRYDVYAPLATSERPEIPYEEAVRSVLETFADFHPLFGETAERVFAEGHVHSTVRKGKKGGAFCYSALPGKTPWLLLNYTGRVRDVTTLAHELGHAVHSMLAAEHSVLTFHASLPLAETASVFGEMLVTDRLLREERDARVRREILAASVDELYATVLRQAYFTLFEIAAHEAIGAGRSPSELADLYLGNLREQFGDSVTVPEEFGLEWLGIPHFFHSPFYCYSYSFGQLLVLSLYRRYQEEGEAFKPGYLKLLAHGGAARPLEILGEVGVEVTDPAFWQGGFDLIAEMVAEAERLPARDAPESLRPPP